MSTSNNVKPVVGMPATMCVGSDSYGGKIVSVSATGKRVVFAREGSPDNMGRTFSMRKNGRYVEEGQDMYGTCLHLGVSETYMDPHF